MEIMLEREAGVICFEDLMHPGKRVHEYFCWKWGGIEVLHLSLWVSLAG